jgi:hypothetical protein
MNSILQELVDGERIDAVGAGPVPDPPHSKNPGNHLFVNCRYTDSFARKRPEALLAAARSDLVRVVNRLMRTNLLDGMRSLSVTFVGSANCMETPQRFYRYSLPSEAFPKMGDEITVEVLLGKGGIIEYSDFDSLVILLKTPPGLPEDE